MILFKSIRQKVGRAILARKLKNLHRKKSVFNFESSQHIGVLFKTDTQGDFEDVKRFLHFLNDMDNKVVALCFVDYNRVPDYYFLRKGFNFFSRRDLNFFFLPKAQFVLDFIEKPFDILIDLNISDNFSLNYISNLSKAKFKIGKFNNGHNCFDVMIDISKNNSIQSLIEQIKVYIPVLSGTN